MIEAFELIMVLATTFILLSGAAARFNMYTEGVKA
jgi:hypothetical protein